MAGNEPMRECPGSVRIHHVLQFVKRRLGSILGPFYAPIQSATGLIAV